MNVCIHRLPLEGETVSKPRRSRCPSCKTTLTWKENVPLVSWLVQLGRCRTCAWPIPWRYPLVEALNAGLWTLVAFLYLPEDWGSALVASIVLSGARRRDLRRLRLLRDPRRGLDRGHRARADRGAPRAAPPRRDAHRDRDDAAGCGAREPLGRADGLHRGDAGRWGLSLGDRLDRRAHLRPGRDGLRRRQAARGGRRLHRPRGRRARAHDRGADGLDRGSAQHGALLRARPQSSALARIEAPGREEPAHRARRRALPSVRAVPRAPGSRSRCWRGASSRVRSTALESRCSLGMMSNDSCVEIRRAPPVRVGTWNTRAP
ncbi:MAG: prepilin peptidase [Planctomycetes bacterium]|nr:prepilin peptidase [Planctomycetota bacterium]